MKTKDKSLGKVSITVEKDYHSLEKEYDKLVIVEEKDAYVTYISRKPIPIGIQLTNREYWIPVGGIKESIVLDYNEFKAEFIAAEAARVLAENERKTNETARTSNEYNRQTNEETRIANETLRQSNENSRESNETNRISSESQRIAAENTRNSNEITRTNNENNRNSNETLRTSAESTRQNNETIRQQQEGLPTDTPSDTGSRWARFKKAEEARDALVEEKVEDITRLQEEKADKDTTAVEGHIAVFNNEGNTVDSNHEVSILNGAIYDISVLHPTSGVSGGNTYASLSAAVDVIPQGKRKGGMTVRYIQSSDNKYVQYRLMTTLFSTDVSDWQGVDAEPIRNSKNLLESEGMAEILYGNNVSRTFNAKAGTNLNTTSYPVNLNVPSGTEVSVLISCDDIGYIEVNQFYIKVNGNFQQLSNKPYINIEKKYTFQNDVTAFGFALNGNNIPSNTIIKLECHTKIGIEGELLKDAEEIGGINIELPLKADENAESVNLFNPDDENIIGDSYIKADGTVGGNSSYIISAPIAVKPGKSIISNKLGASSAGALYENADSTTKGYFLVSTSPYVLSNPTDKVMYARFSYRKDQTNIMVNRGTTSLAYQPYTDSNKVLRETDVVNETGSSTKKPISQKLFTDEISNTIGGDSLVQVLGNNENKIISQAKITELLGLDFGGNVQKKKYTTVSGTALNTTSNPLLFNAKKGDTLHICILGGESNVNAVARVFYYRNNGSFVSTATTIQGELTQGYEYTYIMPADADAFGFVSDGDAHDNGYLQLFIWTQDSIPVDVKNQTIKKWTLARVVRQWMNGDKCPIGFIGDSTTDGTGTTGWSVQNSHPRQDARNWLEDHPEFMPSATTEAREAAAESAGKGRGSVDYICEKAYPYLLEKLIQSELGNNNARVYNIGYYGMALTSYTNVGDFFSEAYSDCKMAGIVLGVNDRGNVNRYGKYYNSVLQLLERYVIWLNRVGITPFMVTNQYVTQSGNNPNTDGGIPDIMYNDDVQAITNRAKVEVAKKYGLEVIDMNGFGRLVFMCSSYTYSNITEDLHFKSLGHKLEAGFLFSQLIPWVNKTGDARTVYIGFGGAYNKSGFNVGKYETGTNDRFKREINYTRSESTNICIFDSYVFNNSLNGAYTVKYLTPAASGYIVIDGDTSNPIIINSTEMTLDPWDIGLHHVQVYTGESTTVAFKGFLLEQN